MAVSGCVRRFNLLIPVLGGLLVALGALVLLPSSVKAANCGDVQVSGSSWAGGSGVDSHYNGSDEGSGNDCHANNPTASYDPYTTLNPDSNHNGGVPQMGNGWQCVEFAQRMYATRGWTSGIFSNVGAAADIYTNASSNGWTTQAQGSIVLANIVPGDMLVTHEATYGHVMVVDSVNTSTNKISAVDQNGEDGGKTTVTYNPTTKNISDGSYCQFSGVVHSPNNKLTNGGSGGSSPSTPSAVSRDSSDMAVFYGDGNGNLVNYSWNSSSGWSTQQWADSGGIYGQPCVVARDSSDMDVFYYTSQNKLIHRGWNASNGWEGPDVLVSSDDVGDPACVSRDSGDVQVFYRTSEGQIKSVYWNSGSGWNTNPQTLYSSGATGDPYAVSRGSDSMEVFFSKNNGNLVHLGWSSEYGWVTQDWSAGAGVAGKPTAITRNSGGDMSAYYQESGNGKVAEESWDWQYGWSWQDWTAQLVGAPSAVPGVSNVIEDFYRETGGNIVDRYFTGSAWLTANVVGSNGATGNPNAITRGTTNEELFYWNGTSLMDANWNTTSQSWSPSKIN